jgi:hypothetical protein
MGACLVCLGQQDGELVAAEAADDVGPADRLCEDRCDRLQGAVPFSVAAAVVDLFEVVEIEMIVSGEA